MLERKGTPSSPLSPTSARPAVPGGVIEGCHGPYLSVAMQGGGCCRTCSGHTLWGLVSCHLHKKSDRLHFY